MAAPTGGPTDRLDSWKEIAAYLGREVRTVQGWEKTEGLPVHRHQHARLGSVYAFQSELDVWRAARRPAAGTEPAVEPDPPQARVLSGWRAAAAAVVCSVLILGAGLALWQKGRSTAAGGIPSSIVVLPFLDLSPERNQEYFSDGLTEEIIDTLTRVPNLRVVARTSAFAFKGKPADIRRIGQQLNVAAVLEGSVRKAGDQLRITAQLARVSDGYHLWSHTYDRRLKDIFAVQREISQAIADQWRAGEVPRRGGPRDLETWHLYQEGRYFFNRFEPPDSDWKAIERYRQALARDPGFAQAYAGIADAYAYLAENFAMAPREVMPRARDAAEKALALDDASAEAHVALGLIRLDYDRDRAGGQREFLRAIELNPGLADARHWYAHSLEAQERLAEAMTEMRRALDLDPLSIPIHWDIANELICAGRYREALAALDQAGELFPDIPVFPFLRLGVYQKTGDMAAAARTIADWRRRHPDEPADDPMLMSFYGLGAALGGSTAEARRVVARMEDLRAGHYIDAFLALPVCAALRDRGLQLRWLKRAVEDRSSMVVYLRLMKRVYGLDDALLTEAGVD